MRIKGKNLILTAMLAVAGLFSATAAIASQKINQEPVVEKAEASFSGKLYLSSSSTRIWLWNSSYNFTGGNWDDRPSTTNGDYGSYYNYSDSSATSGPTQVIFGDSGDLTFDSTKPFCKTGSGSLDTSGLIKFKASNDSWTERAMTWDSSSKTFTYTTGVLPANTQFGFQAYNYRTGFIGYGSDMGVSSTYLGKEGSNYKTLKAGVWSFTLTADAYGNYGDMTYGMTATFKYAITYDRNKNDGTQYIQTVTPGSSLTILTPGTSPLNDSGWNTNDMKYFKHWNTTYDDKGDNVATGSSVTPTTSYTLYFIEDYWEFRVKVGSGEWKGLSWDLGEGGMPSGCKGQFSSAAMELTAGQTLTFQINKHDGAGWVSINPSYTFDSNNNYTTSITYTTNDKLWLKIKTDGSYACFVPGKTEYTIRVGGGTTYAMVGSGYTPGGYAQMKANALVKARVGQIVEISNGSSYWRGYIVSGSQGFNESENNVTCTETGEYTFYLQKNEFDQWNNIYTERDVSASANYFATLFNTTILDGICDEDGDTDKAALTSAWGANSSSGLYKDYNSQNSAVKALYVANSSDAEIARMIRMYDYIVGKYGTTVAPDFLGRNPSPLGAFRGINLATIFGSDEDGLPTVIIIVASSVALLSVTALSILVIKKRKNKEE